METENKICLDADRIVAKIADDLGVEALTARYSVLNSTDILSELSLPDRRKVSLLLARDLMIGAQGADPASDAERALLACLRSRIDTILT